MNAPRSLSPCRPRAALAAVLLAAAVPGQNLVQINEIDFTPGAQWIEVANFDDAPFDIGGWSIYQATRTANQPQAYWWGFPNGTVIPARGFVRVRWLNPVETGNTNPLLLDTGDTPYHFLFFLRGESLARDGGALALCATKNGEQVNTASFYRDFVAWGAAGGLYPRETLAVQNGRWLFGGRVQQPFESQSLALDSRDLREPTRLDAFFRDLSPTPSAANHGQQSSTPFGTSCVFGLGQPSNLSFWSLPVHGNADYRVVVDNLVPDRSLVILFFGTPLPTGRPWEPPCRVWLDLERTWAAQYFIPSATALYYRPPLESVYALESGVQAAVVLPGDTIALTNGGYSVY